MAMIRILYKILPSDVEEKTIENIISNIKILSSEMEFKLNDYKIEPIAFGLNALKILLSLEEKSDDLLEKIETKLSNMKGVSSIEVIGMTRD